MPKGFHLRKLQLALLLALLPSIVPRLTHLLPALKLSDFGVYDTASVLARNHQGIDIYNGADNGIDPQTRYADPSSHFAAAARQLGIPMTMLYVYPPTLADLLVPFSFLPFRTAGLLWTALNYVELSIICYLIASLLELKLRSWQTLALVVALFCAQPVVSCIAWGQVTLLLTLFWIYGMWLYSRGWVRTSAMMFALAAAIKVSPLIAVLPFLIWKEWRWLRAFASTLVLLTAGMLVVNGPATLLDFLFHVMPAMSRGIASTSNQTILATVQFIYIWMHHGSLLLGSPEAPKSLITAGKLASGLLLLAALISLLRLGSRLSLRGRIRALAIISMLSAPLAPVTWPHGYIVASLALAFCWADAFRFQISTVRLCFLTVCTIAVSSYLIPGGVSYLINHHGRPGLVLLLSIFTPLAIVLLCLTEAAYLSEDSPVEPSLASSVAAR